MQRHVGRSISVEFEARTYSVAQVGQLLGISRTFAYEQAKTGNIAGIPVIRLGTRMVVPREPVDRLLRGEQEVA